MSYYVGIDNGKKGGIAIIDKDQEVVLITPMPIIKTGVLEQYDINAINDIFNDMPEPDKVYVCLEKAYTLPLNGCKANFTTGYQFGIIEAVLTCNGVSYEIVNAKMWQKEIFQGDTVKDTKQSSIMFCKKKWPNLDFKVGNKESDGISDALCLAMYSFRKNKVEDNK